MDITVARKGLEIAIIDFTLSRLQSAAGEVAFCDLNADPELFMGPKGDVQAETYRRMKKATKGKWEEHCPRTNCLWVHYMADILMNQKEYHTTSEQRHALKSFRKSSLMYKCAADMIWDDLFQDLITVHGEA